MKPGVNTCWLLALWIGAPGETCTYAVRFSPATAGLGEADLSVATDMGGREEILVHLQGEGVQ